MKITYYGHSSFGIEMGGKNILFDPFISPNELAKKIDINNIKADYILLSHGHSDHIADIETIAKNTGATLVSNFEIVTWYGNKGVNGHPMNHGGYWQFDFGKVQYVNAIHSSSFPDGSYAGNPGGFIVQGKEKTFYYAGDTALTYDMKLFGEMNNIDFAFLPIGSNFTMGIEDAIVASDFIKCNHIIGMHYDTFPPIKIDHEKAIKSFADKGKKLELITIGNTITI